MTWIQPLIQPGIFTIGRQLIGNPRIADYNLYTVWENNPEILTRDYDAASIFSWRD